MKKIMLVLACMMIAIGIQAKDIVTKVTVAELPEKAQKFIQEHFQTVQVKSVMQETDEDGIVEYKIFLKDKTAIEFDMVGAWNSVLVKKATMPRFIVPIKVQNAIDKQFANKTIKKVENDGYSFEFDFADGTEAEINVLGDVMEVETK
ncbi:MAG: hypothetical protein EOL95_08105 [Bacteroidia bacterium]|nr:hypothetical protein [Bacteroidia bacterium]